MLDRRSIRSVLIYAVFVGGMWGLGRLGQFYHFGAWFNALPLQYQVPVGIASILAFIVLPFAAMVVILGRRNKNA